MIEIECDLIFVKYFVYSYVKIRDFDNVICILVLF